MILLLTTNLGQMMKRNASKAVRRQGESDAFDDGAWEFKSRQFASAAFQLLELHDEKVDNPTWDSIICLSIAIYLLAIAIELISKAYYLKKNIGSQVAIYNHSVIRLCIDILDNNQVELMSYAETWVVWAGRYPTPKWTDESKKEKYDVISNVIGGMEYIDAHSYPNVASRDKANELHILYDYISQTWRDYK